jgi:hypothetical protein
MNHIYVHYTYLESSHFHRVKCLPFFDPTNKSAPHTLAVHVCVNAFDKVTI